MAAVRRKTTSKFPLTFHKGSGQWCKVLNGKRWYFGNDREKALSRYVNERDMLLKTGTRVARDPDGVTIDELCNRFLAAKQERVMNGEIGPRMWADYKQTCEQIIKAFGRQRLVTQLRADDFAALRGKLAEKYAPVVLSVSIQRIRTVFKYGYDAELISAPIRFGPTFAKPSKRVLRKARAEQGSRLIQPKDVNRLIEAAEVQLRAMILLGINCGFGQGDCSDLPTAALKRKGWIEFSRPKTGIARRAALWAETQSALDVATAQRPTPRDHADTNCVFITRFGRRWIRFVAATGDHEGYRCDSIGQEFSKLARRLKIQATFYDLRHTFRTVADEVRDQPAAMLVMGHADDSINGVYRESISDERLIRISETVRSWLDLAKPSD